MHLCYNAKNVIGLSRWRPTRTDLYPCAFLMFWNKINFSLKPQHLVTTAFVWLVLSAFTLHLFIHLTTILKSCLLEVHTPRSIYPSRNSIMLGRSWDSNATCSTWYYSIIEHEHNILTSCSPNKLKVVKPYEIKSVITSQACSSLQIHF